FTLPPPQLRFTLFPYTTLFRSAILASLVNCDLNPLVSPAVAAAIVRRSCPSAECSSLRGPAIRARPSAGTGVFSTRTPCARVKRSEAHTSELQSRGHLVCRLLL